MKGKIVKGDSKDLTLVHISVSNPLTAPAGALYIAAVLERDGYRVDFRDYTAGSYWHLDPVEWSSSLEDSADIVGISCMSDTLPFVIAAVEDFKTRHPEKTVILGGPGPTGVARELVASFPFVDVVVAGEGEETILEVMECLTDGKKGGRAGDKANGPGHRSRNGSWRRTNGLSAVKGICHRREEEVHTTSARERIRDLDDLPMPLYDAIEVEKYPMVNIVFSRGCPYRCTFCDVAPMWSRKNFRRSVDSVIDEIKFLKDKHGRKHFEFTDETFVLGQDKIFEFCERLRRDKIDIKWSCTGRVNLITRELLAEMARAGCEAMFFGIESGSDRILERVNKDFAVREAVEVIHTTLEYMRPVASFIWGFPFETEEDLAKTLLLMVYFCQIGVDSRLNRLAPFPLMPLYEEYRTRMTRHEEPGSYSGREPFQTAGYPAKVTNLIKRFPQVFTSFYSFPTDHFEEKSRTVRSLGRYWQTADWLENAEVLTHEANTRGARPSVASDKAREDG